MVTLMCVAEVQHTFRFVDAFKNAGVFGWGMGLVELGVIATGLVLLALPRIRGTTWPLVGVYALACMVPVLLGVLGKHAGERSTKWVLEHLKNPTQQDEDRGYAMARDTLILGAWLTLPGVLLLPLVWIRRRNDGESAT